LRRDIARLRAGEQRFGDLPVGLGHAKIKLMTKVLTQGLCITADDRSDVLVPMTPSRPRSHFLTHRISGEKRLSRHVLLLIYYGLAR